MPGYPFFDQPTPVRPGQLPTIGSGQAYAAPPINMGDIQAQYDAAKRQQEMADTLMKAGYVPNSGGLGALAMMAQAFAGRKLSRKAEESAAAALHRENDYTQQAKAAEIARATATEQSLHDRNRAETVADREANNAAKYGEPPKPQWINRPDGSGGWVTPPSRSPPQQPQPNMQPQSQGVSPEMVQAVIGQESRGNPNAVSPKGAQGLMQIMPATARDPGMGVPPLRDNSPEANQEFGTNYLNALSKKYNGDQRLMLAAYNGGPGRMDAALRAAKGNPDAALAMMPAETRAYVPAVQGRMGAGGTGTGGSSATVSGTIGPDGFQQVLGPTAGAAPSGYRWRPDKTLEAIPGGPAATDALSGNGLETGDAYLATLPPGQSRLIKAIAEGRQAMPNARSKEGIAIARAVQNYDPTADAATIAGRVATQRDFASGGKSGQAVKAIDQLSQHMAALKESMTALHNSDLPAYNYFANKASAAMGRDPVGNFNLNAKAVADELTKAWRGSAGAEADIKSWKEGLTPNMSPEQQQGAMAKLAELVNGADTALQDAYANGMRLNGKAPTFITPQTRKILDSLATPSQPGRTQQSAAPARSAPSGGYAHLWGG